MKNKILFISGVIIIVSLFIILLISIIKDMLHGKWYDWVIGIIILIPFTKIIINALGIILFINPYDDKK